MNPRDSYARSSRGMAYLALDQLNRAIADFDEALKPMPDNPHAYYARGQAKLRRVDIEGGNADIAPARRIQSNIDELFCELRRAINALGRLRHTATDSPCLLLRKNGSLRFEPLSRKFHGSADRRPQDDMCFSGFLGSLSDLPSPGFVRS